MRPFQTATEETRPEGGFLMTHPLSRIRLAALSILSAALMPAAVMAQVDSAALVVRSVTDGGEPLSGVTVVLRSTETGVERTAVTDAEGQATLRALAPGSWELGAGRDGYQRLAGQPIELRVGQTAKVHVTMRPIASGMVTVSGEAPMVDLYRTDISTNILPEQIEMLPVPDRRFEQLAFLAPAAQPDPTPFFDRGGTPVLGGAGSAWSNSYIVDGVDATDPSRGSPELRITQDAIQEFRVIAQGFDAEIGQTAGGAISVVTRSGTNDLHGSIFGFYRAGGLRTQGALEEENVNFSRYHAGFTLGGPIVRDRTHFFAAFEHIDDDNVTLVRPGGDFTGLAADVPRPTVQTLALASFDHRFSATSSGFAKLAWERYGGDNDQVGGVADQSYGWSFNSEGLTLLVGHTLIIDDIRLNEARVQLGSGSGETPLNSDARTEFFSSGSTLQTGANLNGNFTADQRRFRASDTFHWQPSSRHGLRFGAAYQYYRQSFAGNRFEHGMLVYQNDTRDLPLVYFFGDGSGDITYTTEVIGVFFRDDWRVTDTLTLGLGLRYDLDLDGNNPGFEHPLVSGRSLDRDNIQPRFGFTWDLSGAGRTIVRGGAGRYTGRFIHFPAIWELQYNGETGRILQSRVSVPGLPIDWQNPDTSGFLLEPDIVLLGNDLEAPESTQASLGVSHRLGDTGLVLEADLSWVEERNELVYFDDNWSGNDPACVTMPFLCRPNSDYNIIDRYDSEGRSRFRALTLGVAGTLRGGHLVNASVIVADKKSIMDDAGTMYKPSDSADLEAEWGRSNVDERFRLVVSGVFLLPWDLTLAPIYEYGSGRPWNVLYGFDANGDGSRFDRPPEHDRNDQDGPRFSQLSLRLTKAIRFARGGRLDLIVEVFNLFNTINYDVNSVDNARFVEGGQNERFGKYTATLPPREIQLGLRYAF
jgi:hypothetical protein